MKKTLALMTVSLAAVVAACGSSSSSGADTTSAKASTFNDADVMFAQMMIPHHEQAIEMSDIALDPTVGASPRILQLATQIKNAQDPEITRMKNLLASWSRPEAADEDVDHSSMMSGMMSADDMAELGKRTGTDFDAAWSEAMIAHHEGAIEMAEAVLKDGTNDESRSLAQAIVDGQLAEIATLREILEGTR